MHRGIQATVAVEGMDSSRCRLGGCRGGLRRCGGGGAVGADGYAVFRRQPRRSSASARHRLVPILRKDFIIDAYQVAEARAAGADAVLLIVAALRDEDLRALLVEVERWGMEALVETHDPEEVARAVTAGARIIGVNHRDLRTFEMNMELAAAMRPLIPSDRLVVAESGIRTAEDVHRLREAGVDAILVGETLMQAPDPGAALRALLAGP